MSKKIYKNKGCSSSMDQTLLNIIKSMEYYFSRKKNIIKGCKTSENQLNSPLVLQQHEQNISIDFSELNEYDHDHDYDDGEEEEEEEEGNKLNLSREVLQQHEQISIEFSELNEYDHDHDYDYGEEEEEGNKLNLSREVLQQQEQISIDFSELNEYDHDHDRDYDYDYDYDYDDDDGEEEEEEEEEGKKLNLSREVVINERWKNHYSNCHKILLVGEGDFSFSNSLAMAFGSATNMIATSLDSQGFLASNYGNAMSNIENLQNRGCMVVHGVDATQMANYFRQMGLKFDRVVFNFPLAGFFQNESRSSQLSRNRTLIRMFLKSAKKMIMDGGEIHITHKSTGYFREWDLESLASGVGLQLIEEEPFNFREYLGYRTKYGFGGDKNFNCNPCKTYKFGFAFGIPKYHMTTWENWE